MNTEEFYAEYDRRRQTRRDLMRTLGGTVAGGLVGLSLAACGDSSSNTIGTNNGGSTSRDIDILNFALNLEYLDSEYYTYATTGAGIDSAGVGITGTGTQGPTTGGAKINFDDGTIAAVANQIAADERAQVTTIRSTITSLGGTPIAKPPIDLATPPKAQGFDPTTTNGFLIATRSFEDTAVTAYGGTARYLFNHDVAQSSARIQAVEAYHAGAVRYLLAVRGVQVPTLDTLDAQYLPPPKGTAYFPVMPSTGLAPVRTVRDVLNIVLMATATNPTPTTGGFFPNGVNGSLTSIISLP